MLDTFVPSKLVNVKCKMLFRNHSTKTSDFDRYILMYEGMSYKRDNLAGGAGLSCVSIIF